MRIENPRNAVDEFKDAKTRARRDELKRRGTDMQRKAFARLERQSKTLDFDISSLENAIKTHEERRQKVTQSKLQQRLDRLIHALRCQLRDLTLEKIELEIKENS